MPNNNFFEITPENYDDVFDIYQRLTPEEVKAVSGPKVRAYLDVETINVLQDALELLINEGKGHGSPDHSKRKLMQLGYGLEDLKFKFNIKLKRAEGK